MEPVLRPTAACGGAEQPHRLRQSDERLPALGARAASSSRGVPLTYLNRESIDYRDRSQLGRVDLIDPRQGTPLAALYPLDRAANADGRRAVIEPADHGAPAAEKRAPGEFPPLLKKLLADYSATGLPPAYLPQKPDSQKPQGETS